MKKFLLSALFVAGAAMAASAGETVTFDFTQTNAYGITSPTTASTGTDFTNGQKITEGVVEMTVTFGDSDSSKPRIWMTTKNALEFRAYTGQSITFTSTTDNITKMEFTGGKTAKMSSGEVGAFSGANWTGDAKSVTVTFGATVNVSTITLTLGGEVVPPTPVQKVAVEKVTSVSDGKFAFWFPEGAATLIDDGGKGYGYSFLEAVTVENDEFEIAEANLFEIAAADNGYTIKDSQNRFLGMDASHFGSFNLYTDATEGNCYWDFTFDGDNVTISNTGRDGAYIACKAYNSQYEMVTTDNADMVLPVLYKVKATDAIEAVEAADADAPVEYFNLQGVRVANPENGLYIRRQGGKVTKVVL